MVNNANTVVHNTDKMLSYRGETALQGPL